MAAYPSDAIRTRITMDGMKIAKQNKTKSLKTDNTAASWLQDIHDKGPLRVKWLAIKSLFKWGGGGEEKTTEQFGTLPICSLIRQAEGSRQVQLHGYPEKMQEGARLRHAGQGNQSSHIVSAVLSFTQRTHMPVTLRNHLWRVYLSPNFTAASQDSQRIKRGSKMWISSSPISIWAGILCHFSLCNNGISLKCKAVFGVVVVVFLKRKEESERCDVTRVLPFLTSSSLSKTCARLGSSESTNHIGGVDG